MATSELHARRLHRFQEQVHSVRDVSTCFPMSDGMRVHLGQTLRDQRKAAKVKLVRIGAALDKSEASLSRFESGKTWPNDLDAAVSAYATELDITPLDIWTGALQHWLQAERPAQVEQEITSAVQSRPPAGKRTAKGAQTNGRKRAAGS